MEHLLIPYTSVSSLGSGPALILAPHPDDEVLGCCGAILSHLGAGDPVRVVVVTDGAANVEEASDYAQERQTESRAAAAVIGYDDIHFWHYPDRELAYGEALIRRILAELDDCGARVLYAPSVYERHPDHRVVAMAAVEALRRVRQGLLLAMYEVAVPLNPNRLLDITRYESLKRKAIECFRSQLAQQDYGRQILALNAFRSYTLPGQVKLAEGYLVTDRQGAARALSDLYLPEYQRQRRLGLEMDAGERPLVSIIVRTTGRRELTQALDSIALQTYPNIEVCLVAANGHDYSEIGGYCGRFPLRVLATGQSLKRSRAANLGLEKAFGDLLMFLDDDDWLDPDHVSVLADALEAEDARVVYSGVRCVYQGGEAGRQGFNERFDAVRLLVVNYIPIHAVLFSRGLVEEGCRLDENMERYEDWDFWIQLSQKTRFVHLDRITANYRIGPKSGFGVGLPDTEAIAYLLNKWRERWSDEQLRQIVSWARERMETRWMETELEARRSQAATDQKRIQALLRQSEKYEAQAKRLAEDLSLIRNSRAYRLYRAMRAPWRGLKAWIARAST